MLLRLYEKRRAISPVITTIFLFAVIIGGIAVSLGIIYPQMRRLEDQSNLETAGSTLISLDKDIQTLITNGVDSKIYKEIDAGRTGLLRIDKTSYSNISIMEGGFPVSTFTLPHNRFHIIQYVNTNYFTEGTASYLIGGADQSYFFLNSSTRQYVSWSIINQSREIGSDQVYTSLSYRNIIKSNIVVEEINLRVNVTAEIQLVNFSIPDGGILQDSGQRNRIELKYLGSKVLLNNWSRYNDDVSLRTATFLDTGDNTPFIEVPFYAEEPVGEGSSFYFRLKFIYHNIEVTL